MDKVATQVSRIGVAICFNLRPIYNHLQPFTSMVVIY